MVNIVLNGERREIESKLTLDQLLEKFSLPKQRIAIELNKSVVTRGDWTATLVDEGDAIEVIHFVGGG